MKASKQDIQQVEKRLQNDSNVEIKLEASSILVAYHQREEAKRTETKRPVYKKKWFQVGVPLLTASMAIAITCGVIYWPKSSNLLYEVPNLTASSKKLMFEANNLSGCLDMGVSISSSKMLLARIERENDEDDDDSEEAGGSTASLPESECLYVAKTYHSLFSILNKSDDSSGSFTNSGGTYIYESSHYGSKLSLTADPSNLPTSFEASLKHDETTYGLGGSYSNGLLSFAIANADSTSKGTYTEEVNALRKNRRTFSYKDATQKLYFDADFEDGNELDVEMGRDLYANGLLTESLEFDSSFEEKKAEVELSYQKGSYEIEDMSFYATVNDKDTVYEFASYSFALSNI